ncbi:MAG: hypothetical protein NTZ83_06420 [Candidatus Pacearchaeota archaeon]|nr:hypothetical protein [Candidatus Pacearchaeota archaeon]
MITAKSPIKIQQLKAMQDLETLKASDVIAIRQVGKSAGLATVLENDRDVLIICQPEKVGKLIYLGISKDRINIENNTIVYDPKAVTYEERTNFYEGVNVSILETLSKSGLAA